MANALSDTLGATIGLNVVKPPSISAKINPQYYTGSTGLPQYRMVDVATLGFAPDVLGRFQKYGISQVPEYLKYYVGNQREASLPDLWRTYSNYSGGRGPEFYSTNILPPGWRQMEGDFRWLGSDRGETMSYQDPFTKSPVNITYKPSDGGVFGDEEKQWMALRAIDQWMNTKDAAGLQALMSPQTLAGLAAIAAPVAGLGALGAFGGVGAGLGTVANPGAIGAIESGALGSGTLGSSGVLGSGALAGGLGTGLSATEASALLGASGGAGVYGGTGAGAAGLLGGVGSTAAGGGNFLSGLGGALSGLGGGGAAAAAGGLAGMNWLIPAAQTGLGLFGSLMGGQATQDAAEAAARASRRNTRDAVNAQMQMYQQMREDLAPQRALFDAASPAIQRLALGYSPPEASYMQALKDYRLNLENDPIYQAQKDELMRVLNRGFASQGKLVSSDIDNAITRNILPYMQDSYNRGRSNIFDLYNMQSQLSNQEYARLLDLMKIGAGAAGAAGQGALATGQGLSSSYGNLGNVLSNIYQNQGQNAAQMWGGMTGAAMGGLNNYMLYQILSGQK